MKRLLISSLLLDIFVWVPLIICEDRYEVKIVLAFCFAVCLLLGSIITVYNFKKDKITFAMRNFIDFLRKNNII